MSGEDEILEALDQAEEAGPPEDRPLTGLDYTCAFMLRNDAGNKDRLLARHGDDLRYHPSLDWAVWNGKYWEVELGKYAAVDKAEAAMRAIYAEARSFKPPTEEEIERRADEAGVEGDEAFKSFKAAEKKKHRALIDAHLRHARASCNKGKLDSLLSLAEGSRLTPPEAFDARPWIFNAANKAVHLRPDGSHEARPHHRDDLLTRIGSAIYDPKAEAPHWRAFLEQMQPAKEMRSFLQRLAGYLLTGSSIEQAMFIFWGSGSNGKGTFLNAMRGVMGTYAATTPTETFGANRNKDGSGPRPDLVRLRAARLTATGDAPPGFRLDEGIVKQATGEEPLPARDLNKGFIEILIKAKVIIPCNPQPIITGTDDGIWRRVNMVPWPVKMTEEQKRTFQREHGDLAELLAAERSGILNWMLEGYAAWRREGLNAPDIVRAATAEYRAASDSLAEFLNVWTDRVEGARASSSGLFEKYKEFCAANAYGEPKSGPSFGKALKAKGLESFKTDGRKVWLGLRLRETPRDDAPPAEGGSDGAPVDPAAEAEWTRKWNAENGGPQDSAPDSGSAPPTPDEVRRDRDGGGSDRPFGGVSGGGDVPFEDGGFGDGFD